MSAPAGWRKEAGVRWRKAGVKHHVERRASGRHGWYGQSPWVFWTMRGDRVAAGPFARLRDATKAAEVFG